MKAVHKEATQIESAIQKRIHGGNLNVASCRVTVARARQIRIHFRFGIAAIAKSSAPRWVLYADLETEGVSVFTRALKIKRCQSRSWQGQGQGGVEFFWQGYCEGNFDSV